MCRLTRPRSASERVGSKQTVLSIRDIQAIVIRDIQAIADVGYREARAESRRLARARCPSTPKRVLQGPDGQLGAGRHNDELSRPPHMKQLTSTHSTISRHVRLTQPPPPSRSSRMRVVVVVAPRRPHLAVNHRHADRPHLTDAAHHHRATRYTSGLNV